MSKTPCLLILLAVGTAALCRTACADSPPASLTAPGFKPPPVPGGATAPAAPAGAAERSDPTRGDPALEATTHKFDADVAFMNQTLRAMESLDRYKSWVNMRTGPTGRERIIYGLYGVYDTRAERAAALAASAGEPHLPELDDAMRAYIATNDKLAPVLNEADGYYERGDYKVDGMAQGRALHARIVEAAGPFVAARARLENVMRTQKGQLDLIRLAAIEKKEGRDARWHVANVMMQAKQALDVLTDGEYGTVDIARLDERMGTFGTAVKDMDAYKVDHPRAFSGFGSFPDTMLGKLRDVQGRLRRTRGNLRRAAGFDMTFIISDYNTMVTLAPTATDFDDR